MGLKKRWIALMAVLPLAAAAIAWAVEGAADLNVDKNRDINGMPSSAGRIEDPGTTDGVEAVPDAAPPRSLRHHSKARTTHKIKGTKAHNQEEAKAAFQRANDRYEKSLKENGKESETTKAAKKRMKAAHKEMVKYDKKVIKADQEAKENEIKAQQP